MTDDDDLLAALQIAEHMAAKSNNWDVASALVLVRTAWPAMRLALRECSRLEAKTRQQQCEIMELRSELHRERSA